MKVRDLSIDFLRATAIILMTITHVNAVLYRGDNLILDIFTTTGATICFSIFLFCSSYVTGLKISKVDSINLKDTLKRTLEIYIVYLILGIFVTLVLTGGISFTQILNITLLNDVPEFTEFLIAFISFSLLSQIFFKQVKYLLSKPYLFIFITLLIYLTGVILHPIISQFAFPNIVRIFLENIFGYSTLHRFPSTFYLPIYTFGILLSKYRTNRLLIKMLVISVSLYLLLYLTKLSHWYRWPPSPLFLIYGYIYIPVILLVYDTFKKFFSKKWVNMVTMVGKYPLEQFFLSTLLVFIARSILNPSNMVFTSILVNILILGLLILYPIVFHRKMV